MEILYDGCHMEILYDEKIYSAFFSFISVVDTVGIWIMNFNSSFLNLAVGLTGVKMLVIGISISEFFV